MQFTRYVVGAMVSLGLASVPALAQAPEAQSPEQQSGMGMANPGEALESAHQSIESKNMSEASSQMKQAAIEMRSEAKQASSKERKDLDKSAKRLDKMSDEMSAGRTVDPQKADQALAEAAHSLAAYHHDEAEKAMKKNNRESFAQHLRLSADDLERAAKFSGHEAERGVDQAVGGAVELSGKITEGAGAIPKDAGKVVQNLGRSIDRVGKDIRKGSTMKSG